MSEVTITGGVWTYIEELAEGRLPAPDSAEAKEYRAWSWAWEQLRKIEVRLDHDRFVEEVTGARMVY